MMKTGNLFYYYKSLLYRFLHSHKAAMAQNSVTIKWPVQARY